MRIRPCSSDRQVSAGRSVRSFHLACVLPPGLPSVRLSFRSSVGPSVLPFFHPSCLKNCTFGLCTVTYVYWFVRSLVCSLSNLIPSHPISSDLIPSRPISSDLIQSLSISSPISSNLHRSHPISSHLVRSRPILSEFIQSHSRSHPRACSFL